jgi:hypothetical protein
MSDINTLIVSGIVTDKTHDSRGWAHITIKSVKESQSKTDVLEIPVLMWGEKAGKVEVGHIVIAQGYINARIIARKDGSGSFPSISVIATKIDDIVSKTEKQATIDEQVTDDDGIPF